MYCAASFSVVIVNYIVDREGVSNGPDAQLLACGKSLASCQKRIKKTYYRGVNMHQTLFLVSSCLNIKCRRTFKLF